MLRLLKPPRAPKENGAILAFPPLGEVKALVEGNIQLFQDQDPVLEKGIRHRDLREMVRREILSFCGHSPSSVSLDQPWIVTGHQPEAFHPGVWAKLFVTGGLAHKLGGFPLLLSADADECHQAILPYPSWDPKSDQIRRQWVRLGRALPGTPWERVEEPDSTRKAEFLQTMLDWGKRVDWEPILGASLLAETPVAEKGGLGDWLGQFRIQAERSLGLDLPSVKQSQICEGNAFGIFVSHLFGRAREFLEIHNRAVDSYRQRQGITNPGQPVPFLETWGPWLETPFWGWDRQASGPRHRLWVLSGASPVVSLGDPRQSTHHRPGWSQWDPSLANLSSLDFCIRPRALTNTLFFRWFCADWFIHGLGGAIYDRITDELGRDFFGYPAPAYGLLTATLRLPFAPISRADPARLKETLRHYWWNPGVMGRRLGLPENPWVTVHESARKRGDYGLSRRALWEIHRDWRGHYHAWDLAIEKARRDQQSLRLAQNREWSWMFHPRSALQKLFEPLLDL